MLTDLAHVETHNATRVIATLSALHQQLIEWLRTAAYPLWKARGMDAHGFVEALDSRGQPLPESRRARVPARQLFAFAHARRLGWEQDVTPLLRRGLHTFRTHYQRPDGLYRTLVSARGEAKDERALLYDQAFVLLALAVLQQRGELEAVELERHAKGLRTLIETTYATSSGFASDTAPGWRETNPHMHLFEACLEWADISTDASWRAWADSIAELALSRFIDPRTGAIREAFTSDWQAAPCAAGQRVEPGHQFEWAWLLLRWGRNSPASLRAAQRLIEVGERHGVIAGFAINALDDCLNILDAEARLWPQTERLKAALLAADVTRDPQYLVAAVEAAEALTAFHETQVAGVWFDRRSAAGEMIAEPAPASSFYHIVSAILALDDWHRMPTWN